MQHQGGNVEGGPSSRLRPPFPFKPSKTPVCPQTSEPADRASHPHWASGVCIIREIQGPQVPVSPLSSLPVLKSGEQILFQNRLQVPKNSVTHLSPFRLSREMAGLFGRRMIRLCALPFAFAWPARCTQAGVLFASCVPCGHAASGIKSLAGLRQRVAHWAEAFIPSDDPPLLPPHRAYRHEPYRLAVLVCGRCGETGGWREPREASSTMIMILGSLHCYIPPLQFWTRHPPQPRARPSTCICRSSAPRAHASGCRDLGSFF